MGWILAGAGAGSVDIRRPPSCCDLTPASPTHSYTHAFCATPLLRVLSAQCASTCCLFSAMCFRAQTNRLLAMCRCTPHGNSTGLLDFRSAPSADHLCSVQQMLTAYRYESVLESVPAFAQSCPSLLVQIPPLTHRGMHSQTWGK